MVICPGIILPETVFNQQPITDIVFSHNRTASTPLSSTLQTQSEVHSLENDDDGRDTRPNLAARCTHVIYAAYARTANRSSLRARIARSGE